MCLPSNTCTSYNTSKFWQESRLLISSVLAQSSPWLRWLAEEFWSSPPDVQPLQQLRPVCCQSCQRSLLLRNCSLVELDSILCQHAGQASLAAFLGFSWLVSVPASASAPPKAILCQTRVENLSRCFFLQQVQGRAWAAEGGTFPSRLWTSHHISTYIYFSSERSHIWMSVFFILLPTFFVLSFEKQKLRSLSL